MSTPQLRVERGSQSTGRLDGRVVLVTGGARGIGKAIAVEIGLAGAVVAIVGRDITALNDTANQLRQFRIDCTPIRCDVTDEASVEACGDVVDKRYGRIDGVVANAGLPGPTMPLHKLELIDWRFCLTSNLDSVFLTFRRFIPQMISAGSGSLVALSSMTGKRPLHGRTPYAAAKMGVIGLVRTLAAELGEFGIRVNCLCPGAVEGDRIRKVILAQAEARGITTDQASESLVKGSAMGRFVTEAEVARSCLFLLSDLSSGITGEDLNVSAGTVMY